MDQLVSYARPSDAVALITLDDGKRNALSPSMLEQIGGALDRAEADGTGHGTVVLLTGRAGTFSAGFDLGVLRGGGEEAAAMVRGGFELSLRLLEFPSPVVISCPGHALAMGSFLLLSADYRIGALGPYKIGAHEVAIGMTMPWVAIELSRQRLAPAHFHRALINAEIYSPQDAVSSGFLDRAVPADELADAALDIATGLAKLDMPAHRATKLRVRESGLAAMRAGLETDNSIWKARFLSVSD
ncbi:MAG TPA: crotonase/enoyl-CoA hydratase family protein [Pseudonocardia sp.]|jgi:enoyl-CoA hydratase